jgi:plasmid stability protein
MLQMDGKTRRHRSHFFRGVATGREGDNGWTCILLDVQAVSAYNACMQYTIRNIPPYLDEALRARAHEKGKSLNEVTVEALLAGLGLTGEHIKRRDLSDIAGSWVSDPGVEEALEDQRRIDPELWR